MRLFFVEIGVALLAVFAPVQALILSVLALCLADMLTGIWAATKKGESISAAALRRSISKLLIYELVIALSFITEKYLLSDMMPISKLVAAAIAVVELKSLLENANWIVGGDLFKTAILAISSKNDPKVKETESEK